MRPHCGRESKSLVQHRLFGFLFLNHCFISTSLSVSLILYFSVWQVNQEAVAKSSIVHGTMAALRCTARHGAL